tara:strand:+ start:18 stop:923 length:906 start_codon:yes stop_codon:yes gene_type:complete
MPQLKPLLISTFAAAVMLLSSSVLAQNQPPVIVSTSPAVGDFVPVPGKFTFTVVAYDPDGEIKSISVNRGKFVKAHGPTYWTENDDGHTVLTDIRWKSGYYPNTTITKFTVDVEGDQGKVTSRDIIFTINHAPMIELTSPVNGMEFVEPATVTLAAMASDNTADGDLSNVKFFVNGNLLHTSKKAPYEFIWERVYDGEYEVTAAVTDLQKQTIETVPIKISVLQSEIELLNLYFLNEPGSNFTILFNSREGNSYEFQTSDDLQNWIKLGEVQGTGSSIKFTDPRLPIVPFKRNYFRVKLVE